MILLDTCVVIDLLRGIDNPSLPVLAEANIAAISAAELAAGADPGSRRHETLSAVTEQLTILPYTAATAQVHAGLLRHTRHQGRPRRAHDLIIAAHAAEVGATLLTSDPRARFQDLPGVTVEVVPR